MPKYVKLTDKEKQDLIEQHKALVQKMNNALPDGLNNIKVDDNLEARLNDEKETAIYRIGQEMAAKIQKQDQIYNDLEARFGKCKLANNGFSRSLKYGFKTEDTAEARRYNEKMYDLYLHDQEKLAYFRYKDVINFNPQKLYDIADDKQKMAEFYRDNQTLCEDAFVLQSCLAEIQIPKELKDAIVCMKRPLEFLEEPASIVKTAGGPEYFTCPQTITADQCALIQTHPDFKEGITEPLELQFNDKYKKETSMETCKQYLGHFIERGYKFEDGFFIKWKAERKDPHNSVRTSVSFDEVFSNQPNVKIEERDNNSKFQIGCITEAYRKEYMKKWREWYGIMSGDITAERNIDVKAIKDKMKGGWIERTFHTGSAQFDHLMKTFEEYNDPKSEGYMNFDRLDFASRSYWNMKIAKGITYEKAKGNEKNKMKFAHDIFSSIEKLREEKDLRDKIEREMDGQMGIMKRSQPFINAADVALENDEPAIEETKEINKEIVKEEEKKVDEVQEEIDDLAK